MTPQPALVDPQGGPMTGNGGGPMPLAKPGATWSHIAGKRHGVAELQRNGIENFPTPGTQFLQFIRGPGLRVRTHQGGRRTGPLQNQNDKCRDPADGQCTGGEARRGIGPKEE